MGRGQGNHLHRWRDALAPLSFRARALHHAPHATGMSSPLSDEKIIDSWRRNAAPWSTAVREGQIDSRRLVTDRAILEAVMRQAPATALDIGCGEGWLSRALGEHGITTIGVDVVPELVEAARLAAPAGDYRVASYEAIAAGALDVRVDVAVANFSLIGKEAVDALVRRIPSLLVPRGRLIVQTLHPASTLGELPYVDGWRPGSWAGFSPSFTDPAPWFFRTLATWVTLIIESGFVVRELAEPLHPHTLKPASLLIVAEAKP